MITSSIQNSDQSRRVQKRWKWNAKQRNDWARIWVQSTNLMHQPQNRGKSHQGGGDAGVMSYPGGAYQQGSSIQTIWAFNLLTSVGLGSANPKVFRQLTSRGVLWSITLSTRLKGSRRMNNSSIQWYIKPSGAWPINRLGLTSLTRDDVSCHCLATRSPKILEGHIYDCSRQSACINNKTLKVSVGMASNHCVLLQYFASSCQTDLKASNKVREVCSSLLQLWPWMHVVSPIKSAVKSVVILLKAKLEFKIVCLYK